MAIHSMNPQLMPCPKKPKKGLLQSINIGLTPIVTVIILILTFLLLPRLIPVTPLHSQTFSYSFGKTHTDDNAQALLQTVDEGYVIAGRTFSYGAGESDAWLVKTDSNGKVLWNITYGGSDVDWATAIVETTEGGFAFTGSTNSFGVERSDIWVVKTDNTGIEQWQRTFGGQGEECGYDILQTADEGFVLVGYTSSYGLGAKDMWVIKLTGSGDIEWHSTFGGIRDDIGEALIVTPDGGYVLGGQTWSYGMGNNDMWLVKIDEHGIDEWSTVYGGTEREWIEELILTTDGGFAFVGQSWASGLGSRDVWLVKTDEYGTIEWQKTYGGVEKEWAEDLIQTAEEGYAIAGFTSTSGIGSFVDMWLVKTDREGTLLWSRQYGGPSKYNDVASALVQTEDENFVLAGISDAPWFVPYYGGGDIRLIKTDSHGEIMRTGITRTDSNLELVTQSLLLLSSVYILNNIYLRKKRKNVFV
ncbi:MAG: hypothetical protein ACW991_00970 [Candidatus Hodarchaeales archaeon]|jgi:hypothetical protein